MSYTNCICLVNNATIECDKCKCRRCSECVFTHNDHSHDDCRYCEVCILYICSECGKESNDELYGGTCQLCTGVPAYKCGSCNRFIRMDMYKSINYHGTNPCEECNVDLK